MVIYSKQYWGLVIMSLLTTFILLNILNVIIQTVKSLATVKCGKTVAALVNAVAYGLYTIVVVYMMCDLNLYVKAGIIALCNLVGVWVVKFIEEKLRKDKLWKIEATFNKKDTNGNDLICDLIPYRNVLQYNYIDLEKYYIVNFYCATQNESAIAKEFIEKYNGKYFASESKIL